MFFAPAPRATHATGNRGSRGDGHRWAEFSFPVEVEEGSHLEKNRWEVIARQTTIRICEYLKRREPGFENATLIRASDELWHAPLFADFRPGPDNLFVLNTDRVLFERQDVDSFIALREFSRQTAAEAAKRIARPQRTAGPDEIEVRFRGVRRPLAELEPTLQRDRRSGIVCYSIVLKDKEALPVLCDCRIAVAGGGTAGAPAAIAAASRGLKVAVIEGGSGLGGTGTMGGINSYWYGFREGFTAELDRLVERMTERIGGRTGTKAWNIEVKMMTYFEEIMRRQGEIWFRTAAVDAIVKDRAIRGLVVLNPDGLGVVRTDLVIDATGDGDVAVFAGVPYTLGDARGGNLQTFNMCDWRVKEGLFGVNQDIGVMDVGNVFDATRGIFLGHWNSKDYDFSAYPAVRESRHIECEYTVTVEDLLGKRTFPDVIAIGSTDFDQHGLQSSAFARLGYLPYHRDIKEIRIPLRACIPKGIDNLLITGKAFSAERDAFSFMRMQPDMQNMGYAVGLAAAMALQRSGSVRDVDWAELKASLFSKGILRRQDIEPPEPEKPLAALVGAADEPEAFLQLLCQPKERILPLLKTCYGKEDYRRVSLPIAMALAWFGANDGVDEIISCLERLRHEEQHDTIDRAGRPVGGFIEKPDTYWKVNQLITVLGMSGDPKALPVLRELVRETDAGGPPRHHAKLHWRRIPNYDRIVCLCHSLDLLATGEPLDELEALIDKPYIGGHVSRGQSDAEGKYASSLLELMIARTLAKTGSKKGLSVLIEYLDDVQTVLSDHAYSELKRITGKDFGKSSEAWTRGLFHEKAEKYIVSYD